MINESWIIIIAILFVLFGGWWLIRFFNRNKLKEINLRFCPKCGSQEISIFKKGPASGFYGDSIGVQYRCGSCNFESSLFPVADNFVELKKIQQKLTKKR